MSEVKVLELKSAASVIFICELHSLWIFELFDVDKQPGKMAERKTTRTFPSWKKKRQPKRHGPTKYPHQNYPHQKQGFYRALLRETNG